MKRYQLGALLGTVLMTSLTTVCAHDGDYYYYNTQPRYYQSVPPLSGSITIPLGNTYNSPSITFSVPTFVQQPPVVYEHHYYAPPVVYRRPYYSGYTSYREGEHRHHYGHRYNKHYYDD